MIEKIKQLAQENEQNIGIGVSLTNKEYISRTIRAAELAAEQGFAKITLVGNKSEIESLGISSKTHTYHSSNPARTLIELLQQNKIAGAVRGSLSSSKFLNEIKQQFNIANIFRIALLETASHFSFLLCPIGIDEGTNLAEKVTLIRAGTALLRLLNMEGDPIGILSGGRMGDVGRDPGVDKTIAEAEELVSIIRKQGISDNVQHYEILIENAIAARCRLILAPDGVSGNLIYRTLVHLGKGKSHGAWYYNLPHPIIDTSRVGPTFEYESAIAFASAIASKKV